jgi:hypothetical protein
VNPGIGRMLAHERERDLRRRVGRAELYGHGTGAGTDRAGDAAMGLRFHPVRRLGTWTGLIMVRAGQRLAGIDVPSAHVQRPA